MKTILYIIVFAALCVFLFGCGGSDASSDEARDVGTLPVTCAPAGCTQ
jgi:hypothetical protein